jgi:hypothetical protein
MTAVGKVVVATDPTQLDLFEGKPRGDLPGGLVGEVLAPGEEASDNEHPHDEQWYRRGRRALKNEIRSAFQELSIARYLTVFGAVPDKEPFRQWLYAGKDEYIHIAYVWQNPDYRKRVFARLERNPRALRLYSHLSLKPSTRCTKFKGSPYW